PASNATFTLTVTDNLEATANAALTVNVTANTPPSLGTYPNTAVTPGGSTTVTPNAAPNDNGTVASLTASAPGFTGTFFGNTSTGVMTITNAGPAGVYMVTVTATDNCGAITTRIFTLNVNTPPAITGATITPSAAPSDNGSVTSLTASAPGFAGAFAGNPATGVITITGAAPAGTFTVTVTATDNCGTTASKSFTLVVNGPPTLAGQTITR